MIVTTKMAPTIAIVIVMTVDCGVILFALAPFDDVYVNKEIFITLCKDQERLNYGYPWIY
jgi:nitric oxide synthase oxygenase domain/subunit